MRKTHFLCVPFLMAGAVLLNSCSKNLPSAVQNNGAGPVSKGLTNLPANAFWVTLSSDNRYISSYGNQGLNFGTNLPHPTDDPYGVYDGQPVPEIQYVDWNLSGSSANYSYINGAYFDLVEPTFPGAVTSDEVQQYFHDLSLYDLSVETSDPVDYPAPIGSSTGSGDVIEVRGKLVRDHNSPTYMSVVSDSTAYTDPGSQLGAIIRSPYKIYIYGHSTTSGNVSALAFLQNGTQRQVTSFSLTYAINASGDAYLVQGSITLVDGTVVTVNDYVQTS